MGVIILRKGTECSVALFSGNGTIFQTSFNSNIAIARDTGFINTVQRAIYMRKMQRICEAIYTYVYS